MCEVLQRCAELRALALRGLLYNADATAAAVAASCRHLTSLDLRHCSTLSGEGSLQPCTACEPKVKKHTWHFAAACWHQGGSPCLCPLCRVLADAGLAQVARLPFLRCLHLSFCVRITDTGLLQLAAVAAAGGAARGSSSSRGGGGARGAGGRSVSALGLQPQPLPQQQPLWWGPEPPPGSGASNGTAGGSARCTACGTAGSVLEELELYYVEQVRSPRSQGCLLHLCCLYVFVAFDMGLA